jgi:hypothetical protein
MEGKNTMFQRNPAIALIVSGLLGLMIFTAGWPNANAQSINAEVIGTVTDQTGALVPGAEVTIQNLGTGISQKKTSSSVGVFDFPALQIGTYSLKVTAPGFKTYVVASVTLAAGDKIRIDAPLLTGVASESITVSEITASLQTEDSSVGDLVSSQATEDLPLNGRDYVSLVQLAAGVNAGSPSSMNSGNTNDDRRQTGSFSANGQADTSNYNLVDGLDNTGVHNNQIVRPSVESIDQIKILTNNYSASAGRVPGAVVNVITKSGGNNFHGSLFEYFRNDVLDTRDYFATTGPKPEYRFNQYGGSLGGPIQKDRTFFFVAIEGYHQIKGNVALYTVPTAYEQANPGDVSDNPAYAGYLPAAYLPYLGGINPIAKEFFDMWPAPTNSAFTGNYQGTSVVRNKQLSYEAKVDHKFGANDTAFVRFAMAPFNSFVPSGLPVIPANTFPGVNVPISPGGAGPIAITGTSDTNPYSAQIDETHTFTQNLLLQVRGGFARINTLSVPLNYGKNIPTLMSSSWGSTINVPGVPMVSGLPLVYASGYATLGDSIYVPDSVTVNVLQLNGALTYTHKQHVFEAGASIIRRESGVLDSPEAVGGAAFVPLDLRAVLGFRLAPLQGELLGLAAQIQRQNQLSAQITRGLEFSTYLQDDWHVRKNLTLNLGVRYDLFPTPIEKRNRVSNFNLAKLAADPSIATSDPASLWDEASSSNRSDGIGSIYSQVAPRFGFDLELPHDTVVRGGFGIVFEPGTYAASGNIPYFSYYTTYGANPFVDGGIPAPVAPSLSTFVSNAAITNVVSTPKNQKSQYVEEFSLDVQKQFGPNILMVGYTGLRGKNQWYGYAADLPDPVCGTALNQATPCANASQTPAYVYASVMPHITSIFTNDYRARNSYDAFRAQWQRRTAYGLTVSANYTQAHGLAVSSLGNGSTPGTGGIGLNPSNVNYDYGNTGLDIRSRVAGSINYEIPVAAHSNGIEAALLRDWQANTIVYWQTGLPFTVTDGNTNAAGLAYVNLPGVIGDRPNMTKSPKLSHQTNTEFFDTSAFATQSEGTLGNEGVNQVYGPHDRRWDLSLFKTFPIYREAKLQFRAECFNVLNMANFGTPGSEMGVGGFGQITYTSPSESPREFQFALKATF